MRITGIGSRSAPKEILDQATLIGRWCLDNDHWIRSGHAEGMDWAFEQGAQTACKVYLPWPSFNRHLVSLALKSTPQSNPFLESLVEKFHPAPNKLSGPARALMLRNGAQIFGIEAQTKGETTSQAVICWTSNGKASGGTGQAIRIAEAYNIPVLNMFHEQYNTAEKVIKWLTESLLK